MSVYTKVEREQLAQFLSTYPLGDLVDYQGIADGIENTNYFVTTSAGDYVLTLFEALTHAELPYFLNLMAYLAEHQVPSAHPLADSQGRYLREFYAKPAALVQRLRGKGIRQPNPAQCRAIGAALGHMHSVSPDFPHQRANERGPHWWQVTAAEVMPCLDPEETLQLQEELRFQAENRHLNLPRGVIHADLFRDNALFEGDSLSGIIDFYYACNDVLLYDVAVTANDWCSQADGAFDLERLRPFLQAYAGERPFSDAERRAWPVLLRAAALRFWLSRLKDLHFPRPGEMTHIKDPREFQRILQARIELPAAAGLSAE